MFNFVIELRDHPSNELPIVGVAGTFHIPKVGYLIHPSYWGKGIASEALATLVPAIFERFPSLGRDGPQDGGLDYLEGWIDVGNAASRRVLEKCGFVLCEEMDAPQEAPGHVARVAVFRRAREGMDLERMGLIKGREKEGRPTPPVE